MHYKYSNELTEREKAYLSYFTRRGLVSDELWLAGKIITIYILVIIGIFVIISGGDIETSLTITGVWLIPLSMLWGVIIFRIKWDKGRMSPIYNGGYSVVRTKIAYKGSVDYGVKMARSNMPLLFCAYFCEGISEPVVPPTGKLYKLAKDGDDITVLIVESKNIYLGITFNKKYEEKVFDYYNKIKNTHQTSKSNVW